MAYVVTDLTLMGSGNACLACLDEEQLFCVRPLFNPNMYNQITWYKQHGIYQGTRLDLTLLDRPSSNPHSEDSTCTAVNVLEHIDDDAMQELLESSSYGAIDEGFGTSPIPGEKYFRHDCELPVRSIITLKVSSRNITLNQDSYNDGRMKVTIIDDYGFTLSWLPVTDLRYINITGDDFYELKSAAQRADCMYVRLGLTRCHCPPQTNHNGYWLQVNGLYIY